MSYESRKAEVTKTFAEMSRQGTSADDIVLKILGDIPDHYSVRNETSLIAHFIADNMQTRGLSIDGGLTDKIRHLLGQKLLFGIKELIENDYPAYTMLLEPEEDEEYEENDIFQTQRKTSSSKILDAIIRTRRSLETLNSSLDESLQDEIYGILSTRILKILNRNNMQRIDFLRRAIEEAGLQIDDQLRNSIYVTLLNKGIEEILSNTSEDTPDTIKQSTNETMLAAGILSFDIAVANISFAAAVSTRNIQEIVVEIRARGNLPSPG